MKNCRNCKYLITDMFVGICCDLNNVENIDHNDNQCEDWEEYKESEE